MRWLALLALPVTLTALRADPLVSWQRRLNLTLFDFQSGGGELEILNPSTFRFLRCRAKPCAGRAGAAIEAVPFQTVETTAAFEFKTRFLEIRVRKSDGGLQVKSRHNVDMLNEFVRPGAAPRGLFFEHRTPPAERFYGLGPRADREPNLRGRVIATTRPLLLSSLGYGLWFTASSNFQFDLGKSAADRLTIQAPFPDRTEFFFHYGPTVKEILEENYAVAGWTFAPTMAHGENLANASAVPAYAVKAEARPLADLLAWLAHASLSGILVPAFDRPQLSDTPVVDFLPMLYGAPTSPLRRSLRPYLFTYLTEARDRGLPLFRPLAMQYSKDAAAGASRVDEFMLGDELLVATGADVYLPMGLWTDLRTGEQHKGRQTVAVAKAEGVPVYARNGTIVPYERPDGVYELHYFPRLGAEFFFYETGDALPTQAHAGPAAGVLRLEVESRVKRSYEWVVHHVSGVTAIEPASTPHSYDPSRRLLRVTAGEVAAMKGSILNITLAEPLEP